MTATITPDFQFRVVIPTADGQEVVGYFPTLLRAATFQQAIMLEDGLKVVVERFRNGYWWSDWG
jgi:hypothetical protein